MKIKQGRLYAWLGLCVVLTLLIIGVGIVSGYSGGAKETLVRPITAAVDANVQVRLAPVATPLAHLPTAAQANVTTTLVRISANPESSRPQPVSALMAPPPPPAPAKPPVGQQPSHYLGGVPIMMYHYVSLLPLHADAIRRGLTVMPQNFAAQLDYLSSHDYHTITLARYVEWQAAVRVGKPAQALPANPIVLTFDDGYDDNYANAYPLLRQHGMVATFFIITGKVGWQGYMSWQQLRDMNVAGMDIESHTVNHVDLAALNVTRMQYELGASKLALELGLGKPITLICYPSGEYNARVEQVARQVGYIAGITTHYGWAYPSSATFALPRVRVSGGESLYGFVASIGGSMAYIGGK